VDVDGDGLITSGQELFGSATRLSAGQTARHGFEALSALDKNGDGQIDGQDPGFQRLRLWYDHNGDRRSSVEELVGLADSGITSLSLKYTVSPRCDGRGNCERERATFSWRDDSGQTHTGALVDVYLRRQR
jgi:hypothetical protein